MCDCDDAASPASQAGGGTGDLDSEGDGERSRLESPLLPRPIAEARVGLRRNGSELSNNEGVLGVRARSDAPTVFGDKRDGSDLDLVAGVVGAHARRRRRVLMRATR